MTTGDIQNHYRRVLSLLGEKRIKEAFAEISILINAIPEEWQAADKLAELETSYRYMIQYMLDGYNDPNREFVYNSLILSAYTLADTLVEKLQENELNTLYFQKKRYYRQHPDMTLQEACDRLDKTAEELSLNALLSDIENRGDTRLQLRQSAEMAAEELFARIWTNYPAKEQDYDTLHECMSPGHYSSETTAMLMAALTLNILHRYDEKKIDLLLTLYSEHEDEEVSQRALCNALILIYVYRHRVGLSTSLNAHIEALKETSRFVSDTHNIFLQLIKSREAERISKKLTEELLPEMMKLNPSLFKKISPADTNIEIYTPDENPEWQELLEQSGISNKLKELNDLQMEGSDVFLSTFSGLKSFPFFQSIGNWFLPFTDKHSALQELYPAGEEGKNTFLSLITRSRFLCNSDKYSFCLCLKATPEAQRGMLTSQFNIEGTDMEQIEKEGVELSHDKKSKSIANQYVQDFYRFFKLYHRRHEFYNPFARPIDLMKIDALQSILSDDDTLRLIGEFYFKKEFYGDALVLFERLSAHNTTDSGLYQKIGFCQQTLQKYQEALNAYLHADMIQPDNIWTLRRIAACYRTLKDNRKALEYYLRIADIQPDNLSICLNIGHCLVDEKNYDEALKYYFKADYLHPESGKALRPIAWCSFLTGKQEQAQRYYDKILTDKPTALDYMNAGHVEWVVGNTRRALDLYRESISLDGNDSRRFIENFKQDIPDLMHAGIHEEDIPLLLDQLLYQIS
ncbi:MAG: hypothetical protein IJY36_01475 [Coprobacter sp.]|nr:hypothetical protein [Coprobacter sp.]